MRTPRSRQPALLPSLLPLLSLLALTGCDVAGGSWDVRMEVEGAGPATVNVKFAGEPDTGTTTKTELPFDTSRNVGFGWNVLKVEGAAPGTVCRTFVDGAVREEVLVDASGAATCEANNQNP